MTETVMFLGDSTTVGQTHLPSEITDKGGFRGYVMDGLDALYGTGSWVTVGRMTNGPAAYNPHEGHGGFRTQDIQDIIQDILIANPNPTRMTLILGFNDGIQTAWNVGTVSTYTDLLHTLIHTINARSPETDILLGTLWRVDEGLWGAGANAWIAAFNAILRTWTDVRTLETGAAVTSTAMLHDGLHPEGGDAGGYKAIAGVLLAAFPAIFDDAAGADGPPVLSFGSRRRPFGTAESGFGALFGPVIPTGARWKVVDTSDLEHDLTWETSPNLFVARGASGFGSPGVELVLEKLPTSPGSVLRHIQTRPAELHLPITVVADTFGGLVAQVETLRDWFFSGDETERTPIFLRVTRPQDDAERQIACYYAGGLEGSFEPGGPTYVPLVVSLIAPDPYWTDVDPAISAYGQTDLSVSQSVVNPGQLDAYPVWTVTGPGSAIAIVNTTTGKSFSLTANGGITLGVGDTLTIDTRPANQRSDLPILDGLGNSQFSKLTATSALWALPPGLNHFTITMSGTSALTAIGLSFTGRYRGLLR